MSDTPGVVHSIGPLPPVPAGPIASMLKQQVHAALAEIPEGKQGALVGIATEHGVNLAVAHRSKDGRWVTAAWIGKDWQGPIRGGVEVRAVW